MLATVAVTASAATVQAAVTPPAISTGGVRAVGYASAVLTGAINPHTSNTSYYFQYGPTAAYGQQTGVADLHGGSSAVTVSIPVSGLQPITKYHYRLIAVNAAGASTGADKSFTTKKAPLSLQILASPNPVLFGSPAIVQGTLSGTGNGSRTVVLQANPFPYTAGFTNVGNPELTTPTGGFSFPILGLTQATQLRVTTLTKPAVVSPVALEGVAVRIHARVKRTSRPNHPRIYGTVTPAVDGMQVAFMRVTRGRDVLVSGTSLKHRNATSSRFSRVVHINKRGLYRVLVRVTNGAQTSNYSSPLRIR
ncbi:MAG TPA: hypothetical protein VLJ42_12405 [Solirubrobacteraceae bacterium]|nr:hypothetical protein [Solirubrobacteraceae bacterium]